MAPQVAILSQPLTAAGAKEFRVLPAGRFRAQDGSGRPAGLAGWLMNAELAAGIAALLAAREDVLIDYEHQSVKAADNGQPAPAAGWFKSVEWREGDGLYAVGVRWTAKAAAMIRAGEYRFISPVFQYDGGSGEVINLVSAALTNLPALSGLGDLAAALTRQPAPVRRQRESDRGIEAFNRVFGEVGQLHPDTPTPEREAVLARLRSGPESRPVTELASLSPHDAAKLKHAFPGVWGN